MLEIKFIDNTFRLNARKTSVSCYYSISIGEKHEFLWFPELYEINKSYEKNSIHLCGGPYNRPINKPLTYKISLEKAVTYCINYVNKPRKRKKYKC